MMTVSFSLRRCLAGCVRLGLALVSLGAVTHAQVPATDTAPTTAPAVHGDRTITFSILAPEASKVEVALDPGTRRAMTKASNGVWAATIGPLEPEIYRYNFVVDGVRTIDFANPRVQLGRSRHASVIEVPASSPRFDQRQDVAHGALEVRDYPSLVAKIPRRMFVYLPPQYDAAQSRKFPVLYLRHGNGDLEDGWTEAGAAGIILENLIAQRRAEPMIIVMPNGYPSLTGAGSSPEGIEATTRELMMDIIPFVDAHYRTLGDRDNRAIAGLSMGAGQAFIGGLRNIDAFAWIGAFSSGIIGDVNVPAENNIPGLLKDPTSLNGRLRLLFLTCGTEDPRHAGYLKLVERLKAAGVRHEWFSTPGAHEWKVWRHSLAEMLPKLFVPRRP